MDKNISILIFLFTLVLHSTFASDNSRRSFFSEYPTDYEQIVKALIITRDHFSSGWDGKDWTMLDLYNIFHEPFDPSDYLFLPTLGNIDFTEWGHWDGWLKHTVITRSGLDLDSNTFILDNMGYLKEYIRCYDYSGSEGKNKSVYTYNTERKVIEKIYLGWNNNSSTWENTAKYTYTYNSDGDIIADSIYRWDDSSASWTEIQKSEYVYNSEENTTEIFAKAKLQNEWIDYYEVIIDFDTNTNLVEYIWHDQEYGYWKYSFSYYANNSIKESISYTYNSGSWVYSFKYFYSNSDADTMTVISQKWDTVNNVWNSVDSVISISSLDSNGNIIDIISLAWNGDLNIWKPDGKHILTYNLHGNPDKDLTYDWDTTIQEWEINEDYLVEIIYDYTDIIFNSDLLSFKPSILAIQRNGTVRIILQKPPGKNDIIRVYDLQGRLIYSAKPEILNNNTIYNFKISSSNKVYLLAVEHNDLLMKQKIILTR